VHLSLVTFSHYIPLWLCWFADCFGACLAVRPFYDRGNELHDMCLDFTLKEQILGKVVLLLKHLVEAWFSLEAKKHKHRDIIKINYAPECKAASMDDN